MTSMAVPLNGMPRAITHYDLKYTKTRSTIDAYGITSYIDSEHATPLSGDAEIDKPRETKPRAESAGRARPNYEPNLQAAQSQTTSRMTATASRNGKPPDDYGKPEWQATRRSRLARTA